MRIITAYRDFKKRQETISLTVGNFDGVHLGHQALLRALDGQKVAVTFSNHPCEVIYGKEIYRLSTLSHKLALLDQFGVDTTLLLPFSPSLSRQSAEQFLASLHEYIPFTHLALGEGATLGHLKRGDQSSIHAISKVLNFTPLYLPPFSCEGKIISSSYIRTLIEKGELLKASKLFGREFSTQGIVEQGASKGRVLGFKTANLSLQKLAIPPLGVYVVSVLHKKESYHGVANLGLAPTMHNRKSPILEVHILNCESTLYGEEIEVIFHRFLRPEKKFASPEALKKQIAVDILSAKNGEN